MLSPRQIFEDNIRPADLLLKVFRLLEHDALNTEEALLRSLRDLVKAEEDEPYWSFPTVSSWTDPRIGRGSTISDQRTPCVICCDRLLSRQYRFGNVPSNPAEGQPTRSDSTPRTRLRTKERRGIQEPIQGFEIRP